MFLRAPGSEAAPGEPALGGRRTKAQFIKVYGPQGPKITREQRAKAGVDARHFQEALKAKP